MAARRLGARSGESDSLDKPGDREDNLARAEKLKSALSTDENGSVEVDVGASREPDDDPPSPGETETARERRLERARKFRERHKELEVENERLRGERESLSKERELARIEAIQSREAQLNLQRRQTQADPLQSQYDEVWKRKLQLHADITSAQQSGSFAEQRARFEEEAKRLQQSEAVIAAAYVQRQMQPNHELVAKAAYVNTHYGDIMSHPTANPYALRLYELKRIEGDTRPDVEVYEDVARETRSRFGLGRSPDPTESERSRFTGIPNASRTGGKSEPTRVRLTKADQRMARAAYPRLSEKEALERYARVISAKES